MSDEHPPATQVLETEVCWSKRSLNMILNKNLFGISSISHQRTSESWIWRISNASKHDRIGFTEHTDGDCECALKLNIVMCNSAGCRESPSAQKRAACRTSDIDRATRPGFLPIYSRTSAKHCNHCDAVKEAIDEINPISELIALQYWLIYASHETLRNAILFWAPNEITDLQTECPSHPPRQNVTRY